jgi:hypothetical protein
MIDWMIQVFKVMKRSEDSTFFLSVSILDRFFAAMQEQSVVLDSNDLHLYGVVSLFLSSKVEDVVPMFMKEIVRDATHGKFTPKEII